MRSTIILLAVLFSTGLARRADACGSGHEPIIAGVLVVGGAYVGGTAAFAISDIATSDHSVAYGVSETVFNGTAAGIAAYMVASQFEAPYHEDSAVIAGSLIFGVHALLAAHGVYTIIHRPAATEVRRVVVAPAPISNGAILGLSGVF